MARSFNGTSDRIRADAAHIFAGSGTAYSVALWLKVPALASSASTDFCFFCEGNTGSSNSVFALMSLATTSLTAVRVFIKSTTTTILDDVHGTAFDNTWHHIGFAQSNAGAFVRYLDGASTNSGSYTGTSSPNDVAFGALVRNTTTNFFPGSLAHIATWNRQLSAQEMASLANGILPSRLAPTHYWPLWGADSPEPDLVSAGTDGTLTGTALASGGPPTSIYLIGHGWQSLSHSTTAATVTGAAALAGAGTSTAAGSHTAFAAAALAGAGTQTATGVRTRFATAAVAGTGSLTASGLQTSTGAATLTGAGATTASGFQTSTGAADLAGAGSLAALGGDVQFGSSALAGAGTLTAVGIRIRLGTADLAGEGALAATGDLTATGAATLLGIGTITASGRLLGAEAPVTTRTTSGPATGRTQVTTLPGRTLVGTGTGRTSSTLGDN